LKPETRDQKPIIGIGAATWDRLMVVPDFPAQEGVSQASASAEQGGGPVATALAVLAVLGSHTVLLDAQGDDAIGRMILADLADLGVDTSRVRSHQGCQSATAQILVRQRDGARHIHFMPATGPELSPLEVDDELVRGAALLHINGRHEGAAAAAVMTARNAGVPISFDGGAGRWRESLRQFVLTSSIRIVAKDFALKFAATSSLESAARKLLAGAPALLVITDGIKGSWVWSDEGEHFHQPAFPASPVMDTTGCGDVFHGAFLHGWFRNWTLRQSAEFASRVASETVRQLGGRSVLRQASLLKNLESSVLNVSASDPG
jgi:sugar/nucleoside kinase (ribokinase family)